MEKKTYISQEELDRIMSYIKLCEDWNYYIILHNLVAHQRHFNELKDTKPIIPEGIPIPEKNPFEITIRAVNKRLKFYQYKLGLKDINLSTKIFSKRFAVSGKIFYGILNTDKNSYKKTEEGYVYIVKHSHRNPEISKQLTDKKVGISFDYTRRINGLTLGTIGIEVIRAWKMSSHMARFMEKTIHNELKECRLVGEWFSDDDGKLVGEIEKLIELYTPSAVKNK